MASPASTSQSPSPSRQLTVVDVYDLAAAIGKDFESLIDAHGPDTLRDIMPKVRLLRRVLLQRHSKTGHFRLGDVGGIRWHQRARQ